MLGVGLCPQLVHKMIGGDGGSGVDVHGCIDAVHGKVGDGLCLSEQLRGDAVVFGADDEEGRRLRQDLGVGLTAFGDF